MNVNSTRDLEQQDAVDRLIETKKGVVLLPTGYGKTRVGIMTINRVKELKDNPKVLIVTSRVTLVNQ